MKWIALSLLLACAGSDPQPQIELPYVVTKVSDITSTSVKVGADGNVTDKGVTINGTTIPLSGDSTIQVQPLEKYTVKAYARNGKGTAYGENVTFVANCASGFNQTVGFSTTVIATAGTICTTSGNVSFVEFAEGQYSISDISFGLYACAWGDDPAKGVTVNNICGKIVLTGEDQYSGKYVWEIISNDGTHLVIHWYNDFADEAQTTLTGTWPLDLRL